MKRNAYDGKGVFKRGPVAQYAATSNPSENGFAAMRLCSPLDPDCRGGSCWHMSIVRRMIRTWFLRVGPAPRLGDRVEFPDPVCPESKRTKKQQKEYETQQKVMLALNEKRRLVALRRWESVHGEYFPSEGRRHDGSGSVGCVPMLDGQYQDLDGVGSWGRVVRLVEDSR